MQWDTGKACGSAMRGRFHAVGEIFKAKPKNDGMDVITKQRELSLDTRGGR